MWYVTVLKLFDLKRKSSVKKEKSPSRCSSRNLSDVAAFSIRRVDGVAPFLGKKRRANDEKKEKCIASCRANRCTGCIAKRMAKRKTKTEQFVAFVPLMPRRLP